MSATEHVSDPRYEKRVTPDGCLLWEPREGAEEWYPRECEFCNHEAALTCTDQVCRKAGAGEPHLSGCPAIETRLIADCTCLGGAR